MLLIAFGYIAVVLFLHSLELEQLSRQSVRGAVEELRALLEGSGTEPEWQQFTWDRTIVVVEDGSKYGRAT